MCAWRERRCDEMFRRTGSRGVAGKQNAREAEAARAFCGANTFRACELRLHGAAAHQAQAEQSSAKHRVRRGLRYARAATSRRSSGEVQQVALRRPEIKGRGSARAAGERDRHRLCHVVFDVAQERIARRRNFPRCRHCRRVLHHWRRLQIRCCRCCSRTTVHSAIAVRQQARERHRVRGSRREII